MEDMLTLSDEIRARRRRNVIIGVLVVYFTLLFIYAVEISRAQMPYFLRVTGYESVESQGLLVMRFYLMGTREMSPLTEFSIDLTLAQPASGQTWKLFEGFSGRETFVEAATRLPTLEPGEYMARVASRHAGYGEQTDEFPLTITAQAAPHEVAVQILDEKHSQRSRPIVAATLKPPVEARLIPNNGRFVPSLNNTILLAAEETDSGLPAVGLKADLVVKGKTIAELTTDDMGLAWFEYYPVAIGDEAVKATLADKEGNTFTTDTTLVPMGSQVLLTPTKYLVPAGEKLRFKMETLANGDWRIEAFQHGNFLMSAVKTMAGAPGYVDLELPAGTLGPVHVQAAYDVTAPGTTYDVFHAWIYDPREATLPADDPRLKNADPDDPKLADLKLEAPFKKFWSWVNGSPFYPAAAVEPWLRKINALSLKGLSYRPEELARQILSEHPKDFLVLPELANTHEARMKNFASAQQAKRDNLLILLAISGVVVFMTVVMRIVHEVKSREEYTELEVGGKTIALWLVALGVIAAGYGLLIYFLYTLNWYLGT